MLLSSSGTQNTAISVKDKYQTITEAEKGIYVYAVEYLNSIIPAWTLLYDKKEETG